jgi:hypothetical protein
VNESAAELEWLDDVLRRSIDSAGPYLRSSFQMPEHSLAGAQLVRRLDGIAWVALATVTAKGQPRVAPIGALFRHGRFCAPILTKAARARHLRRNPAASLSLYEGSDFAVIVHGGGRLALVDDPWFDELEGAQREAGDGSVLDWGPREEAAFVVVEPDQMYTYARDPAAYLA